jgi:hypothetical protein
MTGEVDGDGFFKQERHVLVTLTLGDLVAVSLMDFSGTGAILSGLDITATDEGLLLSWGSAYGVHGSV